MPLEAYCLNFLVGGPCLTFYESIYISQRVLDVSYLLSVSIFSFLYRLLADGRAGVKKRIVFVKKEEEIKQVKWLKSGKKVPKNRELIRQT